MRSNSKKPHRDYIFYTRDRTSVSQTTGHLPYTEVSKVILALQPTNSTFSIPLLSSHLAIQHPGLEEAEAAQ